MEQVRVNEPREAPPTWAQTPNGMTPKQRDFIEGLRDERELNEEQLAWLNEQLDGSVTRSRASEIISRLLLLPKAEVKTESKASLVELPAGRYAIEAENGELRFYKKWVSRDTKRHAIYVQHGPDETQMNRKTCEAIAAKILAAGVRQCAIRYGMEIGECSNCGRRLTNHISRALGIGPICGGRMFGDDFKAEVKNKRQELKDAGIDPDEEAE